MRKQLLSATFAEHFPHPFLMTVLDKNLRKHEKSVCSGSVFTAEIGRGSRRNRTEKTDELHENLCMAGHAL